MENFCPQCGRVYEGDETVCEDDGERLVILNEEPSLIGREIEDKYTITAELGVGGMGTVYLAHQSSMDREVAVKVLRRQFSQNKMAIKRFLREARAASKLAHPNTITVYDFGQTHDGLLYMVMERLLGRPLADILDELEESGLHWDRAVRILAQVCDSLAEAHQNGITHRDLKPDNIFIEPKFGNPEHVKVLDFGIAKMNDDSNTQATATGMICGTPSYMSPEQAMGKEIDGRSDIYALGILFFEMLTGQRPFAGDTAMEVMLKHLNEDPPALPESVAAEMPPALAELMYRCMSKQADERPMDCMTLKAELMEAAGMGGMMRSASTDRFPAQPKKSRPQTRDAVTAFDKTGLTSPGEATVGGNRRWALVAVLVLLLGGGAAAFAMMGGDEGPEPSEELAKSSPTESVQQDRPAAGGTDKPVEAEGIAEQGGDPPADGVEGGEAEGVEQDAPESAAGHTGALFGRLVASTASLGAALAESAEVAAAKAEEVELSVDSVPRAQVFEGDNLLGTTPLMLTKAKDSGTVKLVLKHPGYRDRTIEMGTTTSIRQQVRLLKRRAAGAKTTKGPKASSGSGGGKKPAGEKKKPHGFGTF